jgi:hypothetical protein
MVFSLFLRMGNKTKIDVSALPFILDTIPVIFKSNPDPPAEEQCRNQADDGRQDCHSQDTAPGEDTGCLCRVMMIHGFVVMA